MIDSDSLLVFHFRLATSPDDIETLVPVSSDPLIEEFLVVPIKIF